MTEVAVVDLDQVQEQVESTKRDRIRCYKCNDYDHFPKDFPTSNIEKEAEHIQQIFSMDDEQTSLKMLVTDTYDNLERVGTTDEITRLCKRIEGKNGPTTFFL